MFHLEIVQLQLMQTDRDKELTKNYKTHIFLQMAMSNKHFYDIHIDVRKGVLGGLTPPLRVKIWADPLPWKLFEQMTP